MAVYKGSEPMRYRGKDVRRIKKYIWMLKFLEALIDGLCAGDDILWR
jgi:hypothetical protein